MKDDKAKTTFIKAIYSNGKIPTKWTEALVTIPKKRDLTFKKNWRDEFYRNRYGNNNTPKNISCFRLYFA